MAINRKELIRLQRKRVDEIKKEIASYLEWDEPLLRSYCNEYQRALQRPFQISSEKELLQRCRSARIIFQGDFHTLPQSQRSVIRILRQLMHRSVRVVLALEMVPIAYQEIVDHYLAGMLDEGTFQEKIDYPSTWGFDWQSYRDLLNFSRLHSIPVKALNLPSSGTLGDIRDRDSAAAGVILDVLENQSDTMVYVVFGDLHIAPSHLPREVERGYQKIHPGNRLKKIILFQNSEHLYWRLADQGLEQETAVLQLGRDAFCLMNATPLVKYSSFLDWLERKSTEKESGYSFEERDSAQEFHDLILFIASFFGINGKGFDDFSLFTNPIPEFLKILSEGYGFSPRKIRNIAGEIQHGQGCILPEANIVYLPRLSLNLAAEQASHFLYYACSGEGIPAATRVEQFYRKVYLEALGFVGSKIVNHNRAGRTVNFYRNFIRKYHRKRLHPMGSFLRRVGRAVLAHHGLEKDLLRGKKSRLRWIYSLEPELHTAVTSSLGHALGERLYQKMIRGQMAKKSIRKLFFHPFQGAPPAQEIYLNLVRKLASPPREN